MVDVLACLGGGGLSGLANKLRQDMLARPGGGGLSFLQENPSKYFKDSLFGIHFR